MDKTIHPSARKTGPAYKRAALGAQKELHWQTFLIALAVAAVIFLPSVFMEQGYFFYRVDFNYQQIPFYQMCHRMVKEGNIFWNWNTDLGANFIGSYSFYLLGSPFFWLTIPFPNWMVPHLMAPLLILKFACAAFTSYFYLRRFTRTPGMAQLGALLYAFSGFSIQNILYNHFHEAIIVFPLLLLAIEQFITENRRGAVTVAVFLAAVVNYFFFVGMAVFCVIYWFVRMIGGHWDLSLKRLLAFAGEILLGVGLAAILLIPSYLSVMQNDRVESRKTGWDALIYSRHPIYPEIIQSFFFPPDIMGKPVMVPDAKTTWFSVAGWLPIFSMTGFFLFLQDKKKHWLRRILLILTVMAMVPILNSAFYAFNSAYYARWFFMPVLMICLATVMGLEEKRADWKRAFRWTAGVTLLLLVILAFFPAKYSGGQVTEWGLFKKDSGGDHFYLIQFIVICAVALLSLAVLTYLLYLRKRRPKLFTRAAVLAVCAVSAGYGLFYVHMGKIPQSEIKNDFIDRLIECELTLPGDSDEYRIDVFEGARNTGMFLGYNSIQAFHSIVPTSIMDFYDYVGVGRFVASEPNTKAYGVRPLLSVKYLLEFSEKKFEEDGKTKMPGYTFLKEQNGYKVYENDNYIPYGFTYDYYMTFDECNAYNDNQRSMLMLKALLLDEEQIERHQDILKPLSDDYIVEKSKNQKAKDMAGNSASEIMEQIKQGDMADQREPVNFTNESFAADCAARAKSASKSFETDSRGFTAAVELDRENLVFFSVPYEEDGWTATVDGKPADIETVNVGFMAVRVPEGAHTVRFDYMTPGLKYGVLLTLGSIVIFILYVFIVRARKKRYPERWLVGYPEGDQLAARFEKDLAEENHLTTEKARDKLTAAPEKPTDGDGPVPKQRS